jgi:competence protein ComEC
VKNIKKLRDSLPFVLAPYPALRLLFVIISGIVAGVNCKIPLENWLFLCALSFFALLAGLLYETIKKIGPSPLAFTTISYTFFVLSSFAAYSDTQMHYAPRYGLVQFSGRSVLLFGRVAVRPDASEKGVGWIMEVEEIVENGRTLRVRDRAKVFMKRGKEAGTPIRYGDMVRVKGQLNLIAEAANQREYNPRQAGRMKQVLVQLYAAGPWLVQHEGAPKLNAMERFIVQPVYDYMMKSLDELIPEGEKRQLAAGVLTGEKEYLPEELFEAFKITGTAHILAVSGLNVGLLVLAIHVCLQRMKVTAAGRWISFLIVLFILVVYSYVTGNSSSVKRAAIMTAVLIGGETLGQKTWSINTLALSDVLILFFDPLDIFNPGFLMTNSAVAAILLLYPRFTVTQQQGGGFFRVTIRFLLESFMVTIAAIIGVSPVIAYYFGTFSLVSLLANIPVVLFSTLLMYALVPMLILNLVSAYAASLFAASAGFLAELTLDSALLFSRAPFASIAVKPDLVEVALYYLTLGVALFFFFQKAAGRFVIAILVGGNLIFWYSFLFCPRPVASTMLTVNLGRNLATLFSSGSESVLIDAGREVRDYKRIAQQLDEFGIAAPVAAVQFYSPDSLITRTPLRYHMLQADTLLKLPSMLVMHPEPRVLKLWSRSRSILVVSGTSRLKATAYCKADIASIWIYRFAKKQQEELTSWIRYARPRQCILIPGSFLTRADLATLHRFAAAHPGMEVRSKTRQVVIP